MPERITLPGISTAFHEFLKSKSHDRENDQTVIFYDFEFLKNRIGLLKKIFPDSALHAVAVKANPLVESIKNFKKMNLGAEAASIGELYLALESGIAPEKIVFDSPVKTRKEIEFALKAGVFINADSIDELKRIDGYFAKLKSASHVGIRINPQVGESKIKMSSVAGKYSKFGVPLNEFGKELSDCFVKYKWLEGVHLHVGSQGCSIEMLLSGIGKIYEFAEKTNKLLEQKKRPNRIKFFDIGGGLPVVYSGNKNNAPIIKYASMIKSKYPKLFNGDYRIITEFGRWINANAGWTATKIEYVKRFRDVNTAMIHVGADLFLRFAYFPKQWHHDLFMTDSSGRLKKSKDKNKYVVAGPLCFAGDVIAKEIALPRAEEGDYIIVRDTGAYTLSMWSRYNSRLIPKVVAYESSVRNKFKVLKQKETLGELFDFWDR